MGGMAIKLSKYYHQLQVTAFASDNNLWIDEFSKAFQKMIGSGYAEGELLNITSIAVEAQRMWGPDNSTAAALGSSSHVLPIMAALCMSAIC